MKNKAAQKLGREGGKAKSLAKAKAARENGRKGGRPKTPMGIIQHRARTALNIAIKKGKVKRKPCERCGELKVDGHHDDYAFPLKVRWLCRTHHTEIHYPLKKK